MKKHLIRSFITILLFPAILCAATQTINTIPSQNSAFLSTLQTFLRDEAPARFRLQYSGFIISGGIGTTSANLTHTVSAAVALPGGYYVSQGAVSHTYTASRTTFVYLDYDNAQTISIANATVNRVGNLLFVTMNAGITAEPTAPTWALRLMKVTTGATAITAVEDLRNVYGAAEYQITSEAEYQITSEAELITALADSSLRGLHVVASFPLSASREITKPIYIDPGAPITCTGYVLTLSAPLLSTGAYQQFVAAAGEVMLTGNEFIKAQWFGAGNGTDEDGQAIETTMDVAYASRSGALDAGLYAIETKIPIVLAKGLSLAPTTSIVLPRELIADFTGTVFDCTGLSGTLFDDSSTAASTPFKIHITGGSVKHCDTVFDLVDELGHGGASSTSGGGVIIENMRFDDVTVQVFNINMQNKPVKVSNCWMLNVVKAATITKCDFALFEDCLLRPTQYCMTTNEQVQFENHGKLELRRLLANPPAFPVASPPINCAWVANYYGSEYPSVNPVTWRSGDFIARDCRWGGESGSMSVVNNYAIAKGFDGGSQVILEGGMAVSANGTRGADGTTVSRRCIVRLWELPDILSVHDLDGVGGARLIDSHDTNAITFTVVPGSVYTARIRTGGNIGAYAGSGDATNCGTYIPPELLQFANKDPIHHNITSNVNVDVSACRGGLLTNTGAVAHVYSMLPTAKAGMEITISGTESGYYLQAYTTDVINGGQYSNYAVRARYKEQFTLHCYNDGVWDIIATNAPVYTERLLGSATCNLSNTGKAKTTIFTVPATTSCIITKVIVKTISTSLAGGTDFDIGSGASCKTWRQTIDLSTMRSASQYMVIPSKSATPVRYPVEAAGNTIGILPITGATASPANATVEVWGYLY